VIAATVNGEPVELPDGCTVGEVVIRCGRGDAGVAVAKNLDVVPRARWGDETLRDGDRIDIVTAVGGG
jgi:sulfur carrier protein